MAAPTLPLNWIAHHDAFVVFLLLSPICIVTVAHARNAPAAAQTDGNFSYLRYRVDYAVRADASSVQTNEYDIRLNTQAAVEQFSQVRLGYSEKMQKLEILEAYTITAAGIRQDVAPTKIYTQESYSSASAAMYADYKVKVVVFPNLAPGARVVYRLRRTQLTPYFPGYFGFWETFSVFTRYDDAVVTLRAPRKLSMHVWVRGVHGFTRPRFQGDQARWEWRYRRSVPLQSQTWSAAQWEFSPTIMVSTFKDWSQLGHAYHVKAGKAAVVTPRVRALADQITAGSAGRRAQATALYNWVARNIRYVAVYLGNGGLEPNRADVILEQHYGDCKDHAVILEALLAAKGIQSTPVLIGADGGPTLPPIAVLGRFNHAINYVPEFNLYLDSTNPYARFGQLPASDLGVPVVHSADGYVTRTPPHDVWANTYVARTEYRFAQDGSLSGETMLDLGSDGKLRHAQCLSSLMRRIGDALRRASWLSPVLMAMGCWSCWGCRMIYSLHSVIAIGSWRVIMLIFLWPEGLRCLTCQAPSQCATSIPLRPLRPTRRRFIATKVCMRRRMYCAFRLTFRLLRFLGVTVFAIVPGVQRGLVSRRADNHGHAPIASSSVAWS